MEEQEEGRGAVKCCLLNMTRYHTHALTAAMLSAKVYQSDNSPTAALTELKWILKTKERA